MLWLFLFLIPRWVEIQKSSFQHLPFQQSTTLFNKKTNKFECSVISSALFLAFSSASTWNSFCFIWLDLFWFNVMFNTFYSLYHNMSFEGQRKLVHTSWSRFSTVYCQTLVNNYQLSHIGSGVWATDAIGARRLSFFLVKHSPVYRDPNLPLYIPFNG